MDVVDWRLRGHDGAKIVGQRGQSPFHPIPRGAQIRQVESDALFNPCIEAITDGHADFAYCRDPERRLEDRVLDALRVWQAALNIGVDPSQVRFVHPDDPAAALDEFMIAQELLGKGLSERLGH